MLVGGNFDARIDLNAADRRAGEPARIGELLTCNCSHGWQKSVARGARI